jgi:hypothetical protein
MDVNGKQIFSVHLITLLISWPACNDDGEALSRSDGRPNVEENRL